MPLPMSRPVKHPKTGIYWFRKAVPERLRPIVGKREEKKTLGTRDASEARRLNAEYLLEVEAKWAALGATADGKPFAAKTLTEREAHERARWMESHWLLRFRDYPSRQKLWRTDLFEHLWQPFRLDQNGLISRGPTDPESHTKVLELERWCFEQADEYCEIREWRLDEGGRQRLAVAFGAAVQRASLTLDKLSQGEISTGGSSPTSAASSGLVGQTRLSTLADAWWREAKALGRKPSTYESYRNTFSNFRAFVRRDDARSITAQDVIAFKDHRLMTPSGRTGKVPSAKTVKDSDLSALKAVFEWAVANQLMATNPAAGVTIKVGKRRRVRSPGFTETEASTILRAAFSERETRDAPNLVRAKRWVPWLCAFTGARVGEILQLRKQDIGRDGEYDFLEITPLAGPVKTDEARKVVIHAQLVALGFLEFVAKAAQGPLFLKPATDGYHRGQMQALKNRLSEHVRTLVPDPNVAPNHGWRHRFKTIGIDVGISERVLDAIQGHRPRNVSASYGEVSLRAQASAMAKIPPLDLDGSVKHLET